MLHREDAAGLIVITQPAHAFVSGQLARQWGNDDSGAFAPRESVCLGAEQHDIGWTAWEREPTLNQATGRPRSFREIPTGEHVRLWADAGPSVLPQNRYAALLVALHGLGLYEWHNYDRDTPEEAATARQFVTETSTWVENVLATLQADPTTAEDAAPENVTRNRRLVAIWDRLSLALCHGVVEPVTIDNVPTATGHATLTLAPYGNDPAHITCTPWPFRTAAVTITCEGRRLGETYSSEAAMRAALAAAPWVPLTFTLCEIA